MNKQAAILGSIIAPLILLVPAWAQQQEEKLTITTYYPSPTGVYQTLRVAPGSNPADCSAAGAPEGKMYYDASGRVLMICSNSTLGGWGYYPVPGAGGLWALNGANLTASNTTWNVSIGTTISSAKLRVDTNGANDGIALVKDPHWLKIMAGTVGDGSYNGIVRANDTALIYTNGTQGTGAFVIAPWAAATSGLRMDADGNVGIGISNPHARLHVNETTALGTSAGDSQLLTKTSGRSGNLFQRNLWLYRNSAGNNWQTASLHDAISVDSSFLSPQTDTRVWWERDPYNRIQSWGTAGNKYMELGPAMLKVSSNMDIRSDFTTGKALYISADAADADAPFIGYETFGPSSSAFSKNILVKMQRTDFVGNVFMADLTENLDPTFKSVVWNPTNGRLFRGAAVSSRRYKENIEDLPLGLDSVMRLHPVSFDFKKEYAPDAPRQIGLIAEEVEMVSPLLVGYKNDQVESVHYDRLGPVLIKAIQEQQQEIVELKRQIAELKKRR